MAYLINKPAASDLLSTSQGVIKDNFNFADAYFGVDHFPFTDTNSQNGAHKQAQFSETVLGVIPAGLKGLGYETLYASTTTNGGQLFYVQGNNATGVQLTGPFTPTNTSATNGYTFLAGGIVLQWGQVSAGTATHISNSTNFNIAFPTASFVVITTPIVNASGAMGQGTISVFSSTTTLFNWVFNKDTGTNYQKFNWLAIGN